MVQASSCLSWDGINLSARAVLLSPLLSDPEIISSSCYAVGDRTPAATWVTPGFTCLQSHLPGSCLPFFPTLLPSIIPAPSTPISCPGTFLYYHTLVSPLNPLCSSAQHLQHLSGLQRPQQLLVQARGPGDICILPAHLTASLPTNAILVKFKVMSTQIPSLGFCRHCRSVLG